MRIWIYPPCHANFVPAVCSKVAKFRRAGKIKTARIASGQSAEDDFLARRTSGEGIDLGSASILTSLIRQYGSEHYFMFASRPARELAFVCADKSNLRSSDRESMLFGHTGTDCSLNISVMPVHSSGRLSKAFVPLTLRQTCTLMKA